MSFDWNNFDAVQMNVASWPLGEPDRSGLVRTEWEIRTLAELPDGLLLDQLNLHQLPGDMSFDLHVLGPRQLSMTCICPEEMPGPVRLGAASVAWRFVDEQVARLWMIGEYPRATLPEFMRQRRELVERIPASIREAWVWLSLIRSEPLLAEVAGRSSQAEYLISVLRDSPKSPDLAEYFSELESRPSVRAETGLSRPLELRRILRAAVEFGIRGVSDGSVDFIAYATERLFDVLFLLERSLGVAVSGGLSMEEDRAWFDDAVSLAEFESLSPGVIDRSRSFCIQLVDFCSRESAQFALRNE
ncbi:MULTISPECIES: hypothetical protein [unclassified Streptomyces]|uniref:hypothetical protein n=1 Tax=Streptomyces TaxID=1883 RepID=UPI000FD8A978|nr:MULTISPECIES: hypothetical protein [unclassified Streptomyces]UQA36068.1 hypothetical protein KRR37_21925 [Streptomyces sp. HNA39]